MERESTKTILKCSCDEKESAMAKRKVVIVAGESGHDQWVGMLERSVKDEAEVKIITDPNQVDAEIVGGARTVVFVTATLRRFAEATKRAHSRVRVVVITGAIPPDVVVWANKAQMTPAIMKDLLLDTGGPP